MSIDKPEKENPLRVCVLSGEKSSLYIHIYVCACIQVFHRPVSGSNISHISLTTHFSMEVSQEFGLRCLRDSYDSSQENSILVAPNHVFFL